MRTLSNLCIACMVIIFISCQKEFTNQIAGNNQKTTERRSPDYFKLPPNGKFVDIDLATGKKMTLYQIDTNFIIEGDMVLTPHQVELLKAMPTENARTFITDFAKYWPLGIVPYVMNSNLSTASQNTILTAMNDWEALVPGLDFVPRISGHTNFILFNATTNINNSNVGKIGGQQIVNLAQDAFWGVDQTSTEHEIGHAIALYHEQSRTDRDNSIWINWGNLRPGMQHNFQTYAALGQPGSQFGPFDFNSIMLYPSFVTDPNFAFDPGQPVMTRLDGTTWGTNFFISPGDVETVSSLYGPPFVRMEFEITVNNTDWSSCCSHVYQEESVTLRLYADRACTIAVAAPRDLEIHFVSYSSNMGGITWEMPSSIVIPTGTSSLSLGMTYYEYRDEWGNVVQQDYSGVKVDPNYPYQYWRPQYF